MNFKWILIASMMMSGGIARATQPKINQPAPSVDLNILQSNPMDLLMLVEPPTEPTPEPTPEPSPSPEPSPAPSPAPSPTPKPDDGKMPQACKDANFTEDQKAKIKDAIYQNMRDKVQLDANLKLAFMTYAHTVMDKNSMKTDGETAAAGITDAVTKLTQSHLSLSNNIMYDIVTPDQREDAFKCVIALHKKYHMRGGDHENGKQKRGKH